jgi:hypothetical protein
MRKLNNEIPRITKAMFNNNISTAAVFMDIEKAFDTTWHSGFLFK